jgi:hypothetical protein
MVELHVPHWSTPPQPSPIGPQFALTAAQVVGVQGGPPPHWLGTPPPPQLVVALQVPQLSVPLQPSPIMPHVACADSQVTRPQPGPESPPMPLPSGPSEPSGTLVVPSGSVVEPSCPGPPPPGALSLQLHAGNDTAIASAKKDKGRKAAFEKRRIG